MLIKTIPVGHLETNCYIVTDENTLGCAVIDPGDESNTIMDYLEDNRLSCKAILLTTRARSPPSRKRPARRSG